MRAGSKIDELLAQGETLLQRARSVQATEGAQDPGLIADYQEWFAVAITILDHDLQPKFRDAFEGGTWTNKIKSFLQAPTAPNILLVAEPTQELPPGIGRFQMPVERCFVGPFETQRQLLREQRARSSSHPGAAIHIGATLSRFSTVVRSVTSRRRGRTALAIEDEYDVQDLVEVALRALVEDVRAEERTPSHAAGSGTMDFILPAERVAVEVKMTRAGLTSKALADELMIDIERYARHPDVQTLVAFVFDRDHRIENPIGFAGDLNRVGPPIDVLVVIAR